MATVLILYLAKNLLINTLTSQCQSCRRRPSLLGQPHQQPEQWSSSQTKYFAIQIDKVLAFRKNHLQQPVYQCWCNQIGRSATVFGQMSEIQLLCKHGNWELGKGNKIFSVCFVWNWRKHLWSDTRLGSPLVRCGPAKWDQIFINMMIDDNISLKHDMELNEELSGPVPAGMTSQTWQE